MHLLIYYFNIVLLMTSSKRRFCYIRESFIHFYQVIRTCI